MAGGDSHGLDACPKLQPGTVYLAPADLHLFIGRDGVCALLDGTRIRHLGIAPGRPWIPFDQLDFQIGALLLAGHRARLDVADVALILLLGFAGHLAVNRIAWRLGIKDTKW